MRVGWFLPHDPTDYTNVSASIWIRCLQLIPYLEEHGVHNVINQPEANTDIAVFVRWQNNDAIAEAARQKERGRKVIYDLVVNYYDLTEVDEVPYLGNPVKAHHVDEAHRMTALADMVTASSANIADRASREHPHTWYLPDSVDMRHFTRRKTRLGFMLRPRPRAIWSGASRKLPEIEPLLPLLREFRLPLTAVTRPLPSGDLPSIHVERESFPYRYHEWTYESFPRDILRGEVCIVYRDLSSTYNQGHSHFKVLVFMAQGVPVIASPVPSYHELLGEPGAGLLCETWDDWRTALTAVTEDRGLLWRWSQEARRRVAPFTTARIAERYVSLFKELHS